jgi:hypothetical protein
MPLFKPHKSIHMFPPKVQKYNMIWRILERKKSEITFEVFGNCDKITTLYVNRDNTHHDSTAMSSSLGRLFEVGGGTNK